MTDLGKVFVEIARAGAGVKPTPKMKPCPECDGEGEWWYDVDYIDNGGLGGRSPVQKRGKCEECKGTGEVEDEDAYDEDEE